MKKSREAVIKYYKELGLINNKALAFYGLSHEQKSDPVAFETFCSTYGGFAGIALSDDEICDDEELVKIAKRYGFFSEYHLLSSRLLSNPEMAIVLADCNHDEYRNIDKRLRDDPELMLKAICINPGIYNTLTARVKANRKIVEEIVRRDAFQLRHLLNVRKEYREPLQNDKGLALIVAREYPRVLHTFFSEEILRDEDVLDTAFGLSDPSKYMTKLLENTWAFRYIAPKYWTENIEFVKAALKEDGAVMELLPDSYRNDKELVLIAIKNCPEMIRLCSESLQDDRDVVMAALQADTEELLSYASERLRADYKVVMRAVKVDGLNLQYASSELRDNREIVLRAIKSFGDVLSVASERLQHDDELIRIAEENS